MDRDKFLMTVEDSLYIPYMQIKGQGWSWSKKELRLLNKILRKTEDSISLIEKLIQIEK